MSRISDKSDVQGVVRWVSRIVNEVVEIRYKRLLSGSKKFFTIRFSPNYCSQLLQNAVLIVLRDQYQF